jgi:hypothetical protein
MKCPECGHESAAQAAFCSRCGSRFVQPPATVGREDVMMTVRSSWWHFLADFLIALDLVAGGLYLLVRGSRTIIGALLAGAGLTVAGLVAFAGKHTTWTLTSERLIAHRALFAQADHEMKLTDTRSISVVRSRLQKLFDVGTVAVASIGKPDFQMLIDGVVNPDEVAQAIKEARRKHFA